MAKKNKPTSSPNSNVSGAAVASSPALGLPSFFTNIPMQTLFLLLLSVLLYANTLTHGFVLDDFMVIKKNTFTQQGFAGLPGILSKDSFWGFFDAMKEDPKQLLVTGGRYRPLSLVVFAIIWQIFGENPFVFHFMTILAYALTGVMLYHLLILMMRPRFGDSFAQLFAWIASVLFICHPLHTEVTANIKGCDEIFSLFGSLAATYFAFKAWDSGLKKDWILSIVCFFLACMSKENAVTFLVVVPMAIWFFRDNRTQETIGHGSILAGLFGAFVVFFVLRGQALDWQFGNEAPFEPMNNPFIKIEGNQWVPFAHTEKLATVFYTLGKYVLLLFIPHPLTHDYYPRQIAILNFTNIGSVLSLVLYFGLGVYAILGIKKRDIVRFGILYYLITLSLVSNLIFSVGTLMNERFLFMPSVGFCIIVAALLIQLFKRGGAIAWTIPVLITTVVAALFSYKTITRNPVWRDNDTLFITDVKTSTRSAKAHDDAGGIFFNHASAEKDEAKKKELLVTAIAHFDTALSMHPRYRHALMHRAASYHLQKNHDKSVAEYRNILTYFSGDQKVMEALALALKEYGRNKGNQQSNPEAAGKALQEAFLLNPTDPQLAWLVGVSYAKQNKFPEAIEWFSKAVDMKPDNAGYVYDLGTAHYRSGNVAKGTEYYAKANVLNPKIGESRGQPAKE